MYLYAIHYFMSKQRVAKKGKEKTKRQRYAKWYKAVVLAGREQNIKATMTSQFEIPHCIAMFPCLNMAYEKFISVVDGLSRRFVLIPATEDIE